MYLLGKRVDTLNAADINRLVDNKVQESKLLDYKMDLRLGQDKDKKEFLYDITSMANTEGGCLVYGIEESKDEKGQNTGTPEAIVGITIDNYDKLVQQVEDIIKGNTDPGIASIGLNRLVVGGKNILIIGISKSLGLPVMVTFNETNKFYRRRNSGKYAVDVYELNQMFMQNLVLKENAEKFRKERIDKVRSLKVFPNLSVKYSFFIHIIPFAFQNELNLDLTKADQMKLSLLMRPMNVSGWDTMYNVDGFATWSSIRTSQIMCYDQLFRNGVYEVYTSTLFEEKILNDGKKLTVMYGNTFIPEVVKKVHDGLGVLNKLKIESPFLISITMLGMKGAVIYSPNSYSWGRPFLVDEIYLPQILIPGYEANIYNLLKPTFDIIWQSVSESQSPPYNFQP